MSETSDIRRMVRHLMAKGEWSFKEGSLREIVCGPVSIKLWYNAWRVTVRVAGYEVRGGWLLERRAMQLYEGMYTRHVRGTQHRKLSEEVA
jgi:hypothetical protein